MPFRFFRPATRAFPSHTVQPWLWLAVVSGVLALVVAGTALAG
ncbi:hypothetical protein Q5H93_11170 [Hymenobacter sp. ASUV-10]|uniref:Uncharacterized protein n=1 Tax=Hymenobacter aranciens TaxID=3063996 RepID=A0ABT9BAJ8_9BACT|nr:hypothetical protein [Hymenobacter sp. ASUV-10]MDO7875295.1 hypothetical protein [Hymenobacter sp. ASUV-10]